MEFVWAKTRKRFYNRLFIKNNIIQAIKAVVHKAACEVR